MYLYRSVYGCGEAEYTIERSRFITHVSPAESPEEARAFIAGIKERYKDATHNVPAFVCGAGSEHQWASDDGEPSGTSGLPVLKMIAGEGLTNLAVVITRYFGGIKLGTGGLARAYTASARLGLDAAGRCEVYESSILKYEFDYTYLSKLQNMSAEGRFEIAEPVYTDVVRADLRCLSEYADELAGIMTNLTSGQARLIAQEEGILRIRKK